MKTQASPTGGPAQRVMRAHIPDRRQALGMSVREADLALQMNGGTRTLLDTTHFDTVRFPPPSWAEEVMTASIRDGTTAYTPYRGSPEVLETLGRSLSNFMGTPLSAGNIVLAGGTQAALFATLSALVDPGDTVLLANPDYLYCERILAFLGARIERVPVRYENDDPHLDLTTVRAALSLKPKMLLFSHPNNPTGAVYPREHLQELVNLAHAAGFMILADELYSRLVYDGVTYTHILSLPAAPGCCIALVGPSKTESLSGFRVGIAVGPEPVMDSVEQCVAMMSLRAPAYAQRLLQSWLLKDEKFVAQRVTDLSELRRMTLSHLEGVPGVRLTPQGGSAYVFPDCTGLNAGDVEIARRLQDDAGVLVAPGYQFGPAGVGHFRACYARDETVWSQALDRIGRCLTAIGHENGQR